MPKKRNLERPAPLVVRPIGPQDWEVIEALFRKNGACGGCWCMWYRVPRGGELWRQSKGLKNKRAFKTLVTGGRAFGCLAFSGPEPVGWCSIGPRGAFPRLERTRAFRTDWGDGTWSVTCFYVRPDWRGRGVATALLAEAVRLARKSGARELEGYPVRPGARGTVPPVFAWTGVPALFERQAFKNVTPAGNARDIYKKAFRRRAAPRA